jgi:aspartyl-tRNA synthetase
MDRVVSMILGTSSIREVIAFPKNRSAFCPLTQAPSPVSRDQLEELGLPGLEGTEKAPGRQQQRDLIETLSWVSRIGIGDPERPLIARALEEATRLAGSIGDHSAAEDPLFSVVDTVNRMRKKGDPCQSSQAGAGEIFRNAPAVKGNYFKVAGILE